MVVGMLCQLISEKDIYRNLVRSGLVGLLLLYSAFLNAGNLVAQVDRQEITLGETLRLTVSFDKQVLFGEPDFTHLETDFEIISRNRQSRFSNNNGKRESYTHWILTLSPKKAGNLIIPSFSFKGEVSDAFEIIVSKPIYSKASRAQIYSEATLEKSSVYVQEQALLTLRLYTAVPLSNFEMSELEIANAQVIPLNESQYQKQLGGENYIVVENQYAIIPEKSGELTIPSVRHQGVARIDYNRRRIAVATEALVLTIKPGPDQASNTLWLPALKVTLSDNWGDKKPTMTVGEPVTRTINLTALGLTAAQLPPLELEQKPDFKLYKDQPQLEDNTSPKGLMGRRTESMAIVPSTPGPLTLPEVKIQWWDIANDRMQTSILPSETFQVLPGTTSLAESTQPVPPPTDVASRPILSNGMISDSAPTVTWVTTLLVTTNILFTLVALTFAILWWRGRGSGSYDFSAVTTGHGQADSNNASFKSIRIAASNQDHARLREAIIQWARSHWHDQSIHTLDQVALRAKDPALKPLFQQLDNCLYSKMKNETEQNSGEIAQTGTNQPDLDTLTKHLAAIHQTPVDHKESRLTELRPLYPQ